MEERRSARVGTVGGLALLAGGTAVAAVAGGHHSVFATVLLGMLAVGTGHALLDEIRRQARRRTIGWARQDTANTVLLATWSAGAITATAVLVAPLQVRAVGAALSLVYALICVFFVVERLRTVQAPPPPPPAVQDVIELQQANEAAFGRPPLRLRSGRTSDVDR